MLEPQKLCRQSTIRSRAVGILPDRRCKDELLSSAHAQKPKKSCNCQNQTDPHSDHSKLSSNWKTPPPGLNTMTISSPETVILTPAGP